MIWFRAPGKINLSLRVLARRPDGRHDIESLVAFSEIGDWLGYHPGPGLDLEVEGPTARDAGPAEKNLVLRAANALAARIPGLTLGRFRLVKHLPAAAGLGGGSSDAAAALAALAEANGLPADDERLWEAAAETGADVPMCLLPKARVVGGVGERLGPPVSLPRRYAVLANPGVAVPTRVIFDALGLAPGSRMELLAEPTVGPASPEIALDAIVAGRNDLQPAAARLFPAIGSALQTLASLPGAMAARMSGSGATCFALFDDPLGTATARRIVKAAQPHWWVKATSLR
jgi:4-diphosphocytidyl-2-C-methyl-D-erythritol kinase